MKRNHLILFVGLIFIHFSLLRIGSFPLTPALPLLGLIVLCFCKFYSNRALFFVLGLWFFIVGCKLLVDSPYMLQNFSKSVNSFGLAVVDTLLLALFVLSKQKPLVFGQLSVLRMVWVRLLCLIFAFCLIQFLSFSVFGNLSLFTPFGSFMYGGQDYLLAVVSAGELKTNGFYLEPSFCALVIFTIYTAVKLDASRAVSPVLEVLFFVSFFLTGSFAGLLAFVLLFTASYALQISVARLIPYVLVAIIVFCSLYALSGHYVSERLMGFFNEGSSTHYRLVAPFPLVVDVLVSSPLGAPFGAMQQDVLDQKLLNGASYGKSIDNGWYYLVYQFGWLGLLAFISAILNLFYAFSVSRSRVVLSLFVLISPLFSGAVLSPEFVFIFVLVLWQYRAVLYEKQA